jgi:hypothetical protein
MNPGEIHPYYQNHPYLDVVLEWLSYSSYENCPHPFEDLKIPVQSNQVRLGTDPAPSNFEFLQELALGTIELQRVLFPADNSELQQYFFCAKDGLGRYICSSQLIPKPSAIDSLINLDAFCKGLGIDPN